MVAVRHSKQEEDVMLKSKLVLVSCVAIVASMLAARTASGKIPHTNYLTFSAPFALPGVSLPAGTYVFDVIVTDSNDIVRVSSRDRLHIYLTTFTRRVQRPRGLPVNRQVVFQEAPAGVAPPINTWFPLGQSIGHQFVYPDGNGALVQGTN
jgi:hypothetical protein